MSSADLQGKTELEGLKGMWLEMSLETHSTYPYRMQLANMGRRSAMHCVEADDLHEHSLIGSMGVIGITFAPHIVRYTLSAGFSIAFASNLL